ncbi:MAG: caspase family protein [Hyphomicrobiales bacterium]
MWACIALATLMLGAATPARAERRLAFVAGIDIYPSLPPEAQLQRAVTDAKTVAATLIGLGFTVDALTNDVSQANFLREFESFVETVQAGDIVFFYFSGHGVGINGSNYLIPADIPALRAGDQKLLQARSLEESYIIERIHERHAQVTIVVIDACRSNPFPKQETRSLGGSKGLERVEPADGVLSIYAASAGQEALDRLPGADDNPNSVFTRIFVEELKKPGLSLHDLGDTVRERVAQLAKAKAGFQQVPAVYEQLLGGRRFFLAGQAPGEPAKPIVSAGLEAAPIDDPDIALANARQEDTEEAYKKLLQRFPAHPRREYILFLWERKTEEGLWSSVEQAKDNAAILSLIDRLLAFFPKGYYAERASKLRDELMAQGKASPPPPQPVDTTSQDLDKAERADTVEAWTAFLQAHPEGTFTSFAKFKLALLTSPTPATAPAVAAATPQAGQPGEAQFYYVTGLDPNGNNWLALRSSPSFQAPWSTTRMGPGTLLTVLERDGEWMHVRLQSGETGWANGKYLACCRQPGAAQMLPAPVAAPPSSGLYYVTGLDPNGNNWLALRYSPSFQSSWSQTKLLPGTLLAVTERVGEWYHVRLQSGETGWANSRYIACCRAAGAVPVPARRDDTLYYFVTDLDPNGNNWLALRYAPSFQSAWSATKMGPGTLLALLGRSGEWLHVRVRSTGETGWANARYVQCCRKAE